jgi:ribosome-binding factor A
MKSYRPERVANVIRTVVGEAIATKLSDPRIEPITSVTRVEVSNDLEHAKVSISVMGDEKAARRTLAGLQSARGYVQQLVARNLATRTCPHVSFHLDDSLKKTAQTLEIIERISAEFETGSSSDEETEA